MNTKIVLIDSKNTIETSKDLEEAGNIIQNGGLVIFPTETVYGLGANGLNAEACKSIYEAKGRPSDNPLILHIANPKDAESYIYTNDLYYRLAKEFMPGPLTIVMKSKDIVPLRVRAGLDTVAIRCPSNPIAHQLIEYSNCPIAAPSANISGRPSPTCAKHVIEDMNGRVDMIIDGGDCDFGLESTIVKIDSETDGVLLRPGKISYEDLKPFFKNLTIANAVKDSLKEGEKVLSPGMKYKHYAPNTKVVLLDGDINSRQKFLRDRNENFAFLCYDDEVESFSFINSNLIFSFGNSQDTLRQAHLLFYQLREIDKLHFDVIYAPLPNQDGVGLALYNRMIRAAAHQVIKL